MNGTAKKLATTPRVLALSVLQPWASLLAVGAKRIETRSSYTSYRGAVAIHANKRFSMQDQLQLKNRRFYSALVAHYALNDFELPHLPTGAILAVADLVECDSTNNLDRIPPRESDEFWFGNYIVDRWMWRFENVRRLEIPIKATGALGLWTPEPTALERLEVLL